MKQSFILITTLLMALNTSAYAIQAPAKPKHAGYTIKTKTGANIKTKSGAVVQIRKKGFHKQPG